MPQFSAQSNRLTSAALTATVALTGTVAGAQAYDETSRMTELSQMQSDNPLTFGIGRTTVEFYGYLKFDLIRDFGAELGNTTFGLGGVTDDDQGTFDNQTGQQTRLGFNTYTPTSLGEFQTQLEIDLYGMNDYEPRIRHANASYLGVLVGQDWTTFMPIASYPGTLDFQGFAGIPFARVDQLRYTHAFGDYELQVAIEQSANNPYGDEVYVAALAYDTDPLLVRGSVIAGNTSNAIGQDGDAYGFNLSTTAQLWKGAELNAGLTYGEGIASYLVFAGNDIDANGDLIENRATYIGLTQEIGEKLSLQAIYGYRDDDTSNPLASTDFERIQTMHLTAQYSLTENATVGAEYFIGHKDAYSGNDYTVDRIQLSAQYNF